MFCSTNNLNTQNQFYSVCNLSFISYLQRHDIIGEIFIHSPFDQAPLKGISSYAPLTD